MLDTDQQDHDFADILYQQWAQTTWAETAYWMPENDNPDDTDYWTVVAVDQQTQEKKLVCDLLTERDADFICGLHGAVPDLIRRLHEAIDEATRKDEANDIAQGQLADALLENHALRLQIAELEKEER